MTRRSLPSSIATIVGIVTMLLIAADLVWELDGTAFGDLALLVVAALPGIVGAVVWISRGEPTLATLLWAVPIGGITATLFFFGSSSPIEWLVVFGAGGGMALMLCTERARGWWYRSVLRMSVPPDAARTRRGVTE